MQDAHRWSALLNSCVAVPLCPKYRCTCALYAKKESQMCRDRQLEEAALYQNLYESDMSEEQLDHGDGIQDCCLMKTSMALDTGVHCIRKDNGISVQVKKGPGCITVQDCWDRREAASNTEHEKWRQQFRSCKSSLSSPMEDLEPIVPEDHPDDASGEPKGGSFPFQRMWDGSANHRDTCLISPSPSGTSSMQISTKRKSPKPASPKPFLSAVLDSEKRTTAEGTKANRKETEKKMVQSYPTSPSSQWAAYFMKVKSSDDEKKSAPDFVRFLKARKAWQASSSEEDGNPKTRERSTSARNVGAGGTGCTGNGIKVRGKKTQVRQKDAEMLRPASAPKSLRKAEKPSDEDLTFRPTINKGVPNFERLQRKFQEQIERNKVKGKVTICQPFHLHTNPLERHRAWEEPREKKTQELQEEERAWKREGGKCGSCRDCMPEEQPAPPLNRTFQKRQEAVRKQDRERMAEYRAELQEMEERIKHRPFLFEQTKKPSLKRHICRLLADLGLDEESLWQQESGELQDNKLKEQLNKKGIRPQTARRSQENDCRCWHEVEAR
ncbi:testis-specific protein 10-interacting protein isoform X2 [Rhinatrema bivittatum]|uniref:testis-specific protein 10-interacting protein isoform X2 n=1 Tax=Rhinatrema bivittatum TaxID=194408 RepID=UPI001126135A|nr:testis-specific protein 10-interacting protein isoform X2 [Rhinatrema bivittatum]